MKKSIIILFGAICLTTTSAQAQQVNTLYFLENTPMRHLTNPALQPVSDGYLQIIPFLGYTSLWGGNNSLTMSDLIYSKNGQWITALHPSEDRNLLMKRIRQNLTVSEDLTANLLAFGFRKDKGYVTVGIDMRIESGVSLPKSLNQFLFNGGMQDMTGVNTLSLTGFNVGLQVYTEVYGGYSYQINDQWAVGGKLKVLLGIANASIRSKSLYIDASSEEWRLHGNEAVYVAGPLNWDGLPTDLTRESIDNFDVNALLPEFNGVSDYLKLAIPSGYGASVDLGMTYKPIEQVQISAAINDLGLMYWNNGRKISAALDTVYTGVGDFDYADYIVDGVFQTDSLVGDIKGNMLGLLNNATIGSRKGFARMASARLNVGVDANFWDNRVGVGILSSTRLYNNHLFEEVTLGASFRPFNWFNLAVSYSLVNNGKGSNIGAGLSFMPYDGINLTLAADYVPTDYASLTTTGEKVIKGIPYKTKGVNLAFGLSIVWGTNKHRKDSDKDGVLNKFDVCPRTPKEINGRKVEVDQLGCPKDEDGDGVPDCQDECPETPYQAYGLVDEKGCPIDTDGDGVPDYMDECPGTSSEVYGFVDEKGCALDSDGDGVPDYKDECPNTLPEAVNFVNENGCDRDSDGDGVPDYMDECPNTPAEAYEDIDEKGCPIDSDGDGVPDYLDMCPATPAEAIGFVSETGCELDTDGDGVPDWQDKCPEIAGTKKNKGCPEEKKEVVNIFKKAMQGIQFETGKSVIKKTSYPILNQVAQVFIENPTYYAEVQGHTDNVGKPDLNKKLSQARAEAVRDYLIKQGVEAERLTAMGYGDERPIADNKTAKGRTENRRVEFDIEYKVIHTEVINQYADPESEQTDSVAPATEE